MATPRRKARGKAALVDVVVTVHRAKGLPLAPADWATICRVTAGERSVETRASRGLEPQWDEDLALSFPLDDEDLVLIVEIHRLVPSARPALLGTVMVPAGTLLHGSMPPTPAGGSGRPREGVWYGIQCEDADGGSERLEEAAAGEVMLSFTRAASVAHGRVHAETRGTETPEKNALPVKMGEAVDKSPHPSLARALGSVLEAAVEEAAPPEAQKILSPDVDESAGPVAGIANHVDSAHVPGVVNGSAASEVRADTSSPSIGEDEGSHGSVNGRGSELYQKALRNMVTARVSTSARSDPSVDVDGSGKRKGTAWKEQGVLLGSSMMEVWLGSSPLQKLQALAGVWEEEVREEEHDHPYVEVEWDARQLGGVDASVLVTEDSEQPSAILNGHEGSSNLVHDGEQQGAAERDPFGFLEGEGGALARLLAQKCAALQADLENERAARIEAQAMLRSEKAKARATVPHSAPLLRRRMRSGGVR